MKVTRYVARNDYQVTPITFEVEDNTFIFSGGNDTYKVEKISLNQFRLINNHTHQQHLVYFVQQGDTLELFFEGQVIQGKVFSKQPRAKKAETLGQFTPEIKSPMPGKILKILVKEGDTIEAKQPLILMESMKMELTISSEHPAIVEKIETNIDHLVNLGQILLVLSET